MCKYLHDFRMDVPNATSKSKSESELGGVSNSAQTQCFIVACPTTQSLSKVPVVHHLTHKWVLRRGIKERKMVEWELEADGEVIG
jgi:hypothetical protein